MRGTDPNPTPTPNPNPNPHPNLREAVEEAEGVDCIVQADGEAQRGGRGAAQSLDEHLA